MTSDCTHSPTLLQPRLRVMLVLVVLTAVAALSAACAGPSFEDAMARVFVMRSDDAADRFLGSAFLWGAGAAAVTNAHVTGGADSVRRADQAGLVQTARVIGQDAVRDVAVLPVTPRNDRPRTRPGSGTWRTGPGTWRASGCRFHADPRHGFGQRPAG